MQSVLTVLEINSYWAVVYCAQVTRLVGPSRVRLWDRTKVYPAHGFPWGHKETLILHAMFSWYTKPCY